MPLREHQKKEFDAIQKAFESHRCVLYVSPTGGGKTVVAAHLAMGWVQRRKRVLVLVHRQELLEQMCSELALATDEKYRIDENEIGVIWRDDARTNSDAIVQVASIDTLARRDLPEADYVIVDEAHHSVAPKWQKILVKKYGKAYVLGLTATPMRMDGKALGDSFDVLVEGESIGKLIELGYLRRPRIFVPEDKKMVETKGLAVAAGDYTWKSLAEIGKKKSFTTDAVESLRLHASDRNGVVYCCSQFQADEMAKAINADKVFEARVILGTSSITERSDILAPGGWLDLGHRRLVVTCDVLNEGYNLPSMKLAVLLRPTLSEVVYLQQIGRILRETDGNDFAPIILDHTPNTYRFGRPHDPRRPWTLEGHEKKKRGTSTGPACKRCERCGEVATPRTLVCECGEPFVVPKEVEKVEGVLVEVDPPSEKEVLTGYERVRVDFYKRTLRVTGDKKKAETLSTNVAKQYCMHRFGRHPDL